MTSLTLHTTAGMAEMASAKPGIEKNWIFNNPMEIEARSS